jgi:type III secretion protein C
MKNTKPSNIFSRSMVLLIGTFLLTCGHTVTPLSAAPYNPMALAKPIQLVAREQPLSAFLTDLYGQVGIPVMVSPNVTRLGYVNGQFNKSPSLIYTEIANAFNLVNYYDGSVMHIATSGEVQSRTYSTGLGAGKRLLKNATQLGFIDKNNQLKITKSGMVVATGVKRFLEQIEAIVKAEGSTPVPAIAEEETSKELIVPGVTTKGPSGMAIKVFYLRYAWAQDNVVASGSRQTSIPGIASIVRSLVSAKPSTANGSSNRQRQTRPKLLGQGLSAVGREQDLLGYSQPVNDEGSAPAAPERGLNLPSVATLAETGDVGGDPGQIKVEADPRLNALIIRDRRDRMPMYEQLIRQLDVEPQLIEIEATIIDVNTDMAERLSINWRFSDGKQDVLLGNGTSSDIGLLNRGPAITPIGGGLNISTVIGGASQFISRINLLSSKGAARIVTRPQVMTLSNIEAIFDDSDTFYVRVAGREQVDLFNVSAGTTLRVLPHVFRDKGQSRIRMMISIEDGKIRSGAVDGIPVVNRSSITTQAIMLQGQSLLIGGMVRDIREKSNSKVPYLGDIPIAGNLFKSSRKNETRVERLFLISPRLASVNNPTAQPSPTPEQYLSPNGAPRTYTPKPDISPTAIPNATSKDERPIKDLRFRSKSLGTPEARKILPPYMENTTQVSDYLKSSGMKKWKN